MRLSYHRFLGISKILLIVLTSVFLSSITFYPHAKVKGADPPYSPQPSYLNSSLCPFDWNTNPNITDHQLKTWIEDNIAPKGYHDMVFMFGQCYGGGFIDEMLEFGNDSHPVAAMSSTRYNWTAAGLFGFPGALNDALNNHPDQTIRETFDEAKANDQHAEGGPFYGQNPEYPQYSSRGAGADNLKLGNKGSATSWKAILFAGDPEKWVGDWDHMDGMYTLLKGKFGFTDEDIVVCAADGTYQGSDTLPSGGKIDKSGTANNLENAIKEVAGKMNSTEQFFFWSADHGDFERLVQKPRIDAPPGGDITLPFSLFDWMTSIMKKILTNNPFFRLFSYNVESPYNSAYLNDYFIGNLSPIEGEQILYFDDSVAPLYTDRDNMLVIVPNQADSVGISDVYMSSGAIPRNSEDGVGGIVVPIDKLGLLAPLIFIASTIMIVTTATALYVKRVKRRKEKQ